MITNVLPPFYGSQCTTTWNISILPKPMTWISPVSISVSNFQWHKNAVCIGNSRHQSLMLPLDLCSEPDIQNISHFTTIFNGCEWVREQLAFSHVTDDIYRIRSATWFWAYQFQSTPSYYQIADSSHTSSVFTLEEYFSCVRIRACLDHFMPWSMIVTS